MMGTCFIVCVDNVKYYVDMNENEISAQKPTETEERQIKHAIFHVSAPFQTSEYKRMREAGYSVSYSRSPHQRKKTKNFRELLEQVFPDHEVLLSHSALKDSRRLDHMVFPTNLDDKDIAELLQGVNCFLRKVVHGEQAKHAYFWAPDNKARKEALDMLYKLKGLYAPEKIEDVTDPYRKMPTDELVKRRKEALDFFKKRK